jgi:hypothetical protein
VGHQLCLAAVLAFPQLGHFRFKRRLRQVIPRRGCDIKIFALVCDFGIFAQLGLVFSLGRSSFWSIYIHIPFCCAYFIPCWIYLLKNTFILKLSFGVMTLMTGNLVAAFIAAHLNVKRVSRVRKEVKQSDGVTVWKNEVKSRYVLVCVWTEKELKPKLIA